jgi:magnesium transporter
VTDSEKRLLGVVSFRDLLMTPGDKTIRDVMRTDVLTAPEHMDREALNQLFAKSQLQMIPLVDSEKHIKRVVTRGPYRRIGKRRGRPRQSKP